MIIKNNKLIILLLSIFIFFGTSFTIGQNTQSYIRVGTFNIANLGDTNEFERSLISIVNIILEMDADLICLQEIEPNELGREQVNRLTKLLNKTSGFYKTNNFEYAISEEFTGDELVAFLWRSPVSLQSEITLLDHDEDPDNDGIRTFQRVPAIALFQAGNYDFYVVNCHLYTKLTGKTSEGRGAEYDALLNWLKKLVNEEEKDAIVLGDFNRFLNGKKIWKHLMISNHEDYFRFPLLEAIQRDNPNFNPNKSEAPSDRYSTTTSKKLSIYDQIIISKGSYNKFTISPKFGEDVGIIPFDNDKQYEWFIGSWYDAIKLLSDHRPVWIKMRIDTENNN